MMSVNQTNSDSSRRCCRSKKVQFSEFKVQDRFTGRLWSRAETLPDKTHHMSRSERLRDYYPLCFFFLEAAPAPTPPPRAAGASLPPLLELEPAVSAVA